MYGLAIRKTLYDIWDHLFLLIVLNVPFLAILGAPAYILRGKSSGTASVLACGVLCMAFLCWWTAVEAMFVKNISDYGQTGPREFAAAIKSSVKPAVVLLVCALLFYFAALPAFRFYAKTPTAAGTALAALVFWLVVVITLAMQFFLAGQRRLDAKQAKILKKCFIIFADNGGFSVFCLLGSVILSILLVSVPSFALLFTDESLRLRLKKYDWLLERPEIDGAGGKARKNIPWKEILAEERDDVGTRGLRDFIFPWKQ
jgi:hypothetical protein